MVYASNISFSLYHGLFIECGISCSYSLVFYMNKDLKTLIIEPRHEIVILTCVDSDEPVQSPFKLRNSK